MFSSQLLSALNKLRLSNSTPNSNSKKIFRKTTRLNWLKSKLNHNATEVDVDVDVVAKEAATHLPSDTDLAAMEDLLVGMAAHLQVDTEESVAMVED